MKVDELFHSVDEMEAPDLWPRIERGEGRRVPARVRSRDRVSRARRVAKYLSIAAVATLILVGIALPIKVLLPLVDKDSDQNRASTAAGGEAAGATNGEIMYAKRLSEGWSLFAVDPATGVERQITHGYRDYGSDWSPDGTKIVYDSESAEGDQGIWISNADGSNATKLIDGGSVPAWSPDGTQIAFARGELGKMVSLGEGSSGTPFYIYVMDVDGSNVQRLTYGEHSDYSPTWSPDGTRIAFVRYGSEGSGLFVMNRDGSDQRQLVGPDLEILGAPEWSPDGTSIAIAVNGIKDGAPGGLMLVPADGSSKPTIIPGTEAEYPDHVSNPTWSPDGQWIAYTHGYPEELVIVHPDGSDGYALEVDPGTDSLEELAWGRAVLPASPSP